MGAAYLDYNATAPVRPEAIAAMMQALQSCGNASSVHGFGRQARCRLEQARETVAALAGADPAGLVFTSGASEANILALTGQGRPRRLVSAVEHLSLLKIDQVETIPVNGDGVVDLAALGDLLDADDRPAVVAVMLANNETGVIQPVAEVVRLAHAHGALVHCDAVQAAGKLPLNIKGLGVDSLALSAHKLGGPQGVGALLLADGDTDLRPHQRGGGQERGRRAGTENLPGIAGFAAAARLALAEQPRLTERLERLRRQLEDGVLAAVPAVRVIGERAPRLPNTSCLALPGLTAGTAVMMMDLAGVAISAGSACSSGKVAPSHVLTAMGAGILAGAAIRASLGWASREEEVTAFVAAFAEMASRAGRHRIGGESAA